MGTGTCKRGPRCLVFLALASVALALAACGASSGGASHGGTAPTGAFSWLLPEHPPSSWTVVRIPTGAELAYPPSWRRQHSDRGTATAVLFRSDGTYAGYLNLTPRQGDETLSDWSSFRVEHTRQEGDRSVRRLAAATRLRFLTGNGSCVKDAYTTVTNAHFVEIACLLAGARAESVIVGAAPPSVWGRMSATIERAIAGMRT